MTLVTLAGIGKRFGSGTEALSGVDLTIAAGEFLAILGPSGCGKSTLLRLLAGLIRPTSGTLHWARQPGPPSSARAPERRDIGFVFQEATLLPWADALANVALPLRLAGTPPAERRARAGAALHAMGLAGFEGAMPRELSGGMRMRVSIARALVTRPAVLLLDEPFAALDELTRHKLNDDLLALYARAGVTVVFVTHSVSESVYLASRVVVMAARPGRIASELQVVAPAPREAGFRTSVAYAELCRDASLALARTLA